MIDPATALGIATFSANTLVSYFLKRGFDLAFPKDDDFKDHLRDAIDNTIEKYDEKYGQDSGKLMPFYHSVNVIDELLKFRVMHPEDYDPVQLTNVLENEPGIAPPTKKNIEDFYEIFLANIAADPELKKLEIKQTFDQEIFNISKKVDEVGRQIESMKLAMNGDLQLQWKNRLDSYTETLKAFKPATAIRLLEQLEESFSTSINKPNEHFIALLAYQKGICQQFLGEAEKSARNYLEAFRLAPQNRLYKEQAALAHFKLDNIGKSTEMASELIDQDEYSIMGWALKLLGSTDEEFKVLIDQVPTLVAKNDDFQKIVHNMLMNKDRIEILNVLYKENKLCSLSDFKEFEITIASYNLYIFWILNAVNRYYKNMYVDFREPAARDNELIVFLNERLKILIGVTKGTEIEKETLDFKFLLAFTNFMITREDKFALEMQKHYEDMPGKTFFNALQCANALQQTERYHEAIKIIEGRETTEPEMFMLLAHCYSRTNEDGPHIRAMKSFFSSIDELPDNYLTTYINAMIETAMRGFGSEFSVLEFTEKKSFINPIHKEIISLFADLLYGNISDEDANKLLEFGTNLDDSFTCSMIASGFFFAKRYPLAIKLFRKSGAHEDRGRALHHYIHALAANGKDDAEVLRLLKLWRTDVDFDQEFLLKELQMRSDLREWDEVISICEAYLKEIPKNEGVMNLYLIALNELSTEQSTNKLKEVATQLLDYGFTHPHHITNAGTILIKNGFSKLGFELLHKYAKNPSQIEIRTAYLQACLISSRMSSDIEPMEQFETVEEGAFVKYTRDGKVHFIEMTPTNCINNVFAKFLGRKSGDHFTVKRPMTNQEDTIRIERVMNKYLSLHDEIYEQVATDPFSGIPFAVISIDPNNPGSFFQTLQEMFGESGAKAKIMAQQELKKYYQYQISFTEVVLNPYDKKYLDAYANLVTGKGFATIPIRDFVNDDITEKELIIDFSSTLMLYQISSNHQVDYGRKFKISRYLHEHIKHLLQQMELEQPSEMSISIGGDKPVVNNTPENFKNNRISYTQGLLTWIDQNCNIELASNTLEVIRQNNLVIGENFVVDIIISTMLLGQQSNHVLISDDFFYLKHGFLNFNMMRSTELFIKNLLGKNHNCLNEFINNRYIGFSPNEHQLNEMYSKHLSGLPNNYAFCLENLSAKNSSLNLSSAIKHIKYITLNAVITEDQMQRDVTSVWVGTLRNINTSIRQNLEGRIRMEFALLGLKLDLVLHSLDSAYIILEMENKKSP
ncbi:hypothetical protein CPT03_08415 [Pedobacter ginsengisoli]|uniref:PIN domain-containing protein n=1 Tax=Pedobacter ginsengisoli TaxID=363852 RepID=A0A2D1U4N7_9SPHI|nr:hypothetical protein [Pedobacter ginsengisoli]ATP56494.1 hypothetical protein CPT03_08415 [Pedobacter ginsengisoli]